MSFGKEQSAPVRRAGFTRFLSALFGNCRKTLPSLAGLTTLQKARAAFFKIAEFQNAVLSLKMVELSKTAPHFSMFKSLINIVILWGCSSKRCLSCISQLPENRLVLSICPEVSSKVQPALFFLQKTALPPLIFHFPQNRQKGRMCVIQPFLSVFCAAQRLFSRRSSRIIMHSPKR